MRFEQLRYVLEVAKTHSVSVAANNLYISQSTISDAIKKLEEELQIMIFERTKQGMYLTAVGEKIRATAEIIEKEVSHIYQMAAAEQKNTVEVLEGQLNIYTSFSVDYAKLLRILSLFEQEFSKVNVCILEESFMELLHKIRSGVGDIGIIYCGSENAGILEDDELEYRMITTENFYVLVRRDSKLAHKANVSLKEIIKYPLSLFCFNDVTENMSGGILSSLLDRGEKIMNTFQTNNIQLLQNHILQNDSVGFGFGETILRNTVIHPELVSIKIADKMKIRLYFVFKKDSPKQKLIQSFWKTLQEGDFL